MRKRTPDLWTTISMIALVGCSSSQSVGRDASTGRPGADGGIQGTDAAMRRDASVVLDASDGRRDGAMQADGGTVLTRCELPFEAGPCEAAIPVFWFNAERGVCETRTYGGCEGNDNRFDTLQACQQTCPAIDDVACESDTDCGWGEIGKEILTASDCICLLGCPFIPLNNATIDRREAQHQAQCDPHTDGAGNPCPIDDCIPPPPAECIQGRCTGDLHGG